MPRKAIAYLVLTGILIWAFCGAIMALGPLVFSMETTLVLHLIGGPLGAAVGGYLYFRNFGEVPPLWAAAAVVALALTLDATVVAPVFQQSYEMFGSVIGLWAPMTLIFIAVAATGWFVTGGRQV